MFNRKVIMIIYFFQVYVLLIYVDILLRTKGFHKLFELYINKQYSNEKKRSYYSTRYDELNKKVDKLLKIIDTACAWYPFEAQCLHRTFLAYKLIRKKYGIPVEIAIGVRKFPFQAHAWLTINGYNVNESTEFTEDLKILLTSN